MKLSLIIQAYNEEDRISWTLETYYDTLKKKFKDDFEILVVMNNCSDATSEVITDFWDSMGQPRNLSLYEFKGYTGKGGAV